VIGVIVGAVLGWPQEDAVTPTGNLLTDTASTYHNVFSSGMSLEPAVGACIAAMIVCGAVGLVLNKLFASRGLARRTDFKSNAWWWVLSHAGGLRLRATAGQGRGATCGVQRELEPAQGPAKWADVS